MKCSIRSSQSDSNQCIYCVYPEKIDLKSRDDEVRKLKKTRSLLVRKLLLVEKRLLNPIKKGGDIYASI